ncbi:DUF4390 domain-containing protein [bacterium]|nr:DUF4390 domain-containing protein [candidate division CSSED10-310 bacterium]
MILVLLISVQALAGGLDKPRIVVLEVDPGPTGIHFRAGLTPEYCMGQMEELQQGGVLRFEYLAKLVEERGWWADREVSRMVIVHKVEYDPLAKTYRIIQRSIAGKDVTMTQESDRMCRLMSSIEGDLEWSDRDRGENPYHLEIKSVVHRSTLPDAIKYLLFFIRWDRHTGWSRSDGFRRPSEQEPRP